MKDQDIPRVPCVICGVPLVRVLVDDDRSDRMTYGVFCPDRNKLAHLRKEKEMAEKQQTGAILAGAIRNPVDVRYDVIYPQFLRMMAKIGAVGAAKYGDFNWHKSRLTGADGPVNHIHKHLTSYELGEAYDHKEISSDYKIHLAAIAFNAMMEYYYCENLVESTNYTGRSSEENKIPGGV